MKDKPHDEAMAQAYRKRPTEAFAMFLSLLLDGGQRGESCAPIAMDSPTATPDARVTVHRHDRLAGQRRSRLSPPARHGRGQRAGFGGEDIAGSTGALTASGRCGGILGHDQGFSSS